MQPLTLDEGKPIIEDTILKKRFHPHYTRVTELADKYKMLITGEGIEELLIQFSQREDSVLFAQRKRLTQAITPAVASNIMSPFYKVGRTNPIAKNYVFPDQFADKEEKEKALKEAISKYYGDVSLEEYLEERYVDLNFLDPNSFIVTEFDAVPTGERGEMLDKPKPRPFEVSSHQAINYFYDNNILQWLIVRIDCVYTAGTGELIKEHIGNSYTIYLPNHAIRFTQVDPEQGKSVIIGGYGDAIGYGVNDVEIKIEYFRASEKELFQVEEFEHNADRVPAIRVGYKKDLVTNGHTCVSPLQPALPYFMKTIKSVSELDLTMALHAFPQKFQYVQKCLGESNAVGCDHGKTPEGNICATCGGSGVTIHTSAQDGVVMRIPKNKDDMFPLSDMVHYERPPIDILDFQNKYTIQLTNQARQAVFNSEVFDKTEVSATATEKKISLDSVYDTLFPFGRGFSKIFIYTGLIIARFLDIKVIDIEHKFPKDFKFKTVDELLSQLNLANTSGAPGYIRREFSQDIAEQMFVDKPDELRKINTKQMFFPFPDKNSTEIIFVINGGFTTKYNEILYSNFDQIMSDVEREAMKGDKDFYQMPFDKQKELIDIKVAAYITQINLDVPAPAIAFGADPADDSLDDPNNPDPIIPNE